MAAKSIIKSEATTEGADPVVRTGRGGIGSPSFRTRILQPRFKCVAHCNMSEKRNFNLKMLEVQIILPFRMAG